MAKWKVGDTVEVFRTVTYADGWYGGYHQGDIGTIVEIGHLYLRLDFEDYRKGYRVLKRECRQFSHQGRVLSRIKLMHSRQSSKHPFMEKRYHAG